MSNYELDTRKMHILKAIVDDYIESIEPVGSRTIAKKYDVGLSSATIRNEMADLEEMGYLSQPHTSAGRIPSDKGYRVYVDKLIEIDENRINEFNKVVGYLEQRIDALDQMMKIATRMISRITKYTSFSMTQRQISSFIKACQVVPIDKGRALIVVILDNDDIRNRIVNIDTGIEPDMLIRLSNILNDRLAGYQADEISMVMINEIVTRSGIDRNLILPIVDGIIECLSHTEEAEIHTEGASNLLIHPEFNDFGKAKNLLELVNNNEVLSDLLNQCAEAGGLIVRIGSENNLDQINECSIITATYRINNKEIGTIGVLGPTRMDYTKVISSLEYVRKKLNQEMTRFIGDSS